MTEEPKKRFRKTVEEIDLNLGNLFGTLGQALNEAVNRLDGSGSGQSEQSFETTKGPIRAHAGIRIRTAGSGSAPAKPAPINPGRTRPATPAPRDLTYDLFEDDTAWILTAEMPGAALENLTLAIEDATLILQATGERPYHSRIPLPLPIPVARIETALHNGILTLHFPKDPA